MPKPSPDDQKTILKLVVDAADQMLTLATTVKIQRHLIDTAHSNFREFEAEAAELLHNRLTGTGLLARRSSLARSGYGHDDDFFRDEVALSPAEISAYINGFPLDAAAASYVFTLLEVVGNEIAAIARPGSISRNKAWHEDIRGLADLKDLVQVTKARDAFAKHFAANGSDVPEIAAREMVSLKAERNEFAHDGSSWLHFPSFLRSVLLVLCEILFLTTDEDRLSVYPWTDYRDEFHPVTTAT